jgi:1-acyl-sn-glycerol-3-phosphate acyltransferase
VLKTVDDVRQRIERLEIPFNRHGFDPYGISKKDLGRFLSLQALAYRRYFDVSVHGKEHVPARGRAMLVGNHSGGVALDAAMIVGAMLLELEPPRLAQGMAEKFLNLLPFASQWSSRCGQFTGLPEHAVRLLEDERLLMVFPEGARGTAKLYPARHTLVDFGSGFMRLALQTKTPIVPFAFLGGGDAIPTVFNAYTLGKLFGAPYIPITPYLLPVPRPLMLDIHIGEPMHFEGNGTEDDEAIASNVEKVKERILALIDEGCRQRGESAPPVHEAVR